jgi:hypothetical protein
MSALVVSEKHIDFMISAAVAHGVLDGESPLGLQIAAYKLERENHASVRHLYAHIPQATRNMIRSAPDGARAPRLLGRLDQKLVDPVQVLKAIAFYTYQSCEHPGWATSEARDLCDQIRDAVIRTLPGYDAAPWGIE